MEEKKKFDSGKFDFMDEIGSGCTYVLQYQKTQLKEQFVTLFLFDNFKILQ